MEHNTENFVEKYENGDIEPNDNRLKNMSYSTIKAIQVFKSFDSSNTGELNQKLELVKNYVTSDNAIIEEFLNAFASYTTSEHIAEIKKMLDDTIQMLDYAIVKEPDNNRKMDAFPTAYKNVVNILFLLVDIEVKKYENCQHEYEDMHNEVYSIGCETIRYQCKHCGHRKTVLRKWTEDDYGGLSEHDWHLLTDRD